MSYRTIAVHVNTSRHAKGRMTLAARVAVENDAHLVGIASIGLPPMMYSDGAYPNGTPMLESYLSLMKEYAERALADFETIINRIGVHSFEKRIMDDEAGQALCLQGRCSDLIIVGQPDGEEIVAGERSDVTEYTLLNSGRPTLVVPYTFNDANFGERGAVIAWDGGLAAARAISGAIPLLQRQKRVQVLIFNQEAPLRGYGEQPGVDMAAYLARHGITVEVVRQPIGAEIDIAEALLSHVADFGAELIVMGGYGHSRLREIILGGTTRTVLQSMVVPVLLSH